MHYLPHRRYASGSNWAAWRWKDIMFDGLLYLRRLHLIHTPIGGVMLHWIPNPDPYRDLHDHPTNFISFVIRGEYTEEVPAGNSFTVYKSPRGSVTSNTVLRRIRWVNLKSIPGVHRIVRVHPDTITLVFYGPRRREWGFYTPNRWQTWRRYEGSGTWV